MSNKLTDHISRFIEINRDEETEIVQLFRPASFSKKENLLEPDMRCRHHFFIVSGCLRLFFVDDKGNEQTIQFAIENWWLTDYTAFEKQAQANFAIQAVEKTDVLAIDYPGQEGLLRKFPKLERYFRLIYQRAYAASQFRIKYLFDFSREAIYHHFTNSFPDFTNRIPQHLLASYLNMTPEYLSEIKNKK